MCLHVLIVIVLKEFLVLMLDLYYSLVGSLVQRSHEVACSTVLGVDAWIH